MTKIDPDIQFLNDIDKGVIGIDKPQVVHLERSPLERLQELQGKPWYDADYLPEDAGMDDE